MRETAGGIANLCDGPLEDKIANLLACAEPNCDRLIRAILGAMKECAEGRDVLSPALSLAAHSLIGPIEAAVEEH